MVSAPNRRRFLQASVLAIPTALACTRMVRNARGAEAPRIEAPLVDGLSIQVVTDGNHDIFISGAQVPGESPVGHRALGQDPAAGPAAAPGAQVACVLHELEGGEHARLHLAPPRRCRGKRLSRGHDDPPLPGMAAPRPRVDMVPCSRLVEPPA